MNETIRPDESGQAVEECQASGAGGMTRRSAVMAAAALAASGLAAPAAGAAEPQQDGRRGSEKLIEDLAGLKPGLNPSNVRELLKLLAKGDVKLVDWHTRGTPTIDSVVATVQTPVKSAHVLVGDIYAANLRAIFRGFPRGIPPVFDMVQMEVELGG